MPLEMDNLEFKKYRYAAVILKSMHYLHLTKTLDHK